MDFTQEKDEVTTLQDPCRAGSVCLTLWQHDCSLPADAKGRRLVPLDLGPMNPTQDFPAGWLLCKVTVWCPIKATGKTEISRED